ncbi:pheromone A receptor-domain-containing protein [Amylostereum chailletii]|nr:pheromone A receptor-domain-containing protein [Amylostereum chailletii]
MGDGTQIAEKRNHVSWFDIFFAAGIPAILMGLYHVLQSVQYDVFETVGCFPVHTSVLAYIIWNSWGVICPVISVSFYCPWIFRTFLGQLRDISEFGDRSAGDSRRAQYIRILALGCVDMVIVLPLNILILVADIKEAEPRGFYPGWAISHEDWIPRSIPLIQWEQHFWKALIMRLTQYLGIGMALGFFTFAVTGEALKKWVYIGRLMIRRKGGETLHLSDMSSFNVASRPAGTTDDDV